MMTLTFEEIEIEPCKVFDVNQYPGDGLYIAKDGKIKTIIAVENGMMWTLPLPISILVEDYANRELVEKAINTEDLIRSGFKQLAGLISECNETKTAGQSFDISDITKLVAMSQKPEMFKE